MPQYRARFFLDPGAGVCLWSANDHTRREFDYPVAASALPVSQSMRDQLEALCREFDTAYDWSDPAGPGPWTQSQCDAFNRRARAALESLRDELGEDWEVVDEYRVMHADTE